MRILPAQAHVFSCRNQTFLLAAISTPHRMRCEVWKGAGKGCSVVLKQHITALHLQSPSLGQPQCIQAGSGHSVCGRETDRQTFEIVTATEVLSMGMLKSLVFIFSHSHFFFFFKLAQTHFQIDNRGKNIFRSFIVKHLAFFVPQSFRIMRLFITEGVL